MQVSSVVRHDDIKLQPHHIILVSHLQGEAMHVAKNITKPGLFSLTIVLSLARHCWPGFPGPVSDSDIEWGGNERETGKQTELGGVRFSKSHS